MVSMKGVLTAFVLALTLLSIYKVMSNNETNAIIEQKLMNESVTKSALPILVFAKSLDELTPSIQYDLPGTDKHILLINRFPFVGWTTIIFVVLFLSVAIFFMRMLKAKFYWAFLIFILAVLLGYIVANLVLIGLYYWSAQSIGLTVQDAATLMEQYNNSYDNATLPMIVISLINLSGLGLFWVKK